MTSCKHNRLLLLAEKKSRLRCRHCHLTISAAELGGGHCPECYERDGSKRHDFDETAETETGSVRYRCEDCGAIIAAGQAAGRTEKGTDR